LNGFSCLFPRPKETKKHEEAVVDAPEYGYPPSSAAQQMKVEHESSQVQQLHNLLERKTRQAHSKRVLLYELCFTYTLIHHHVCKT
jgi:hypothetical protein